jgi:hypothetical protein
MTCTMVVTEVKTTAMWNPTLYPYNLNSFMVTIEEAIAILDINLFLAGRVVSSMTKCEAHLFSKLFFLIFLS